MKIKFFAVGGTIDKVYFDALSKYEIGESNINDILKDARVNFKSDVSSIFKKDSLDMTDQDRSAVYKIVKNDTSDKIIITHGTDTMIETAKVLETIKNKTIVLTGAMEPAKFRSSDAVFNLGSAVAAVQTLQHGIYIVISGRVFKPDNVKKDRTLKMFGKKM
ncbi:MAG: asparaginase domain-containing protein [Deltaproteobacteria bacterium]|jgi:L-asparaginase|nr:asparaginase domain-containing protein [Deltaproteobacteria bacterium]